MLKTWDYWTVGSNWVKGASRAFNTCVLVIYESIKYTNTMIKQFCLDKGAMVRLWERKSHHLLNLPQYPYQLLHAVSNCVCAIMCLKTQNLFLLLYEVTGSPALL